MRVSPLQTVCVGKSDRLTHRRVQNFCLRGGTFAVEEGVYIFFCFGGSAFENEVELMKGTIYEVISVPVGGVSSIVHDSE